MKCSVLLIAAWAVCASAQDVVFSHATIIDGTGRAIPDASIIVKNGHVAAIGEFEVAARRQFDRAVKQPGEEAQDRVEPRMDRRQRLDQPVVGRPRPGLPIDLLQQKREHSALAASAAASDWLSGASASAS